MKNELWKTMIAVVPWCCLLTGATVVEAQYAQDRRTNVVSSVSEWTGDYVVGSNTAQNVLIIKDGGRLSDEKGFVGCFQSSDGNSVVVVGKGSYWENRDSLCIGYRSEGNSLVVSNGGMVVSSGAPDPEQAKQGWNIGWVGFWSDRNMAIVTGSGSVWSNRGFCVGEWGKENSLVISSGGRLLSEEAWIGRDPRADRNSAVVTGAGAMWVNSGGLSVGAHGFDCCLDIGDGGTVVAASVTVGENFAPLGGNMPTGYNTLRLDGGSLIVTNSMGNARLVLGESPARFILNSGTARVDQIVVHLGELARYPQHGPNMVMLNGGLLETRSVTIAKNAFLVGNGQGAATIRLLGGTHVFAEGISIRTNSTLTGSATIVGRLLNEGTVSLEKGNSIFNGDVTNRGRIELHEGASVVFNGSVFNEGVIVASRGKVKFTQGVKGGGKVIER